ncbi:signal recognition particle protein [Desulfonatronovibrio magnus]|uniref:signal recognition particle protein n=1 Tax=Desulfonatronovibrio magnus TaxID=698827 RepID=UPI0005EAD707|nr:signal recognition particle protein [Desulfonatronovibrio magnus]
MFDSLSDRLNSVFKKLRGQGRLDEKSIQEGMRQVRLALLEADVNYKVVRDFTEKIRERAMGQDVLKSLTPGQQVIKIVNDELVELLGGDQEGLDLKTRPPVIIMLVGLQGSGKTTSTAKLALYLRRLNYSPYLVPADVYRPAAIDQLTRLGQELDMPVHPSQSHDNPVDICAQAIEVAHQKAHTAVLLDTAGRLHVDQKLMNELVMIKEKCSPHELLFVADAMTGQDAVNVAQKFNELLDVTGIILTKMEGDARGGAALSIKSVTNKPIKFIGTGEKLSDLELFHPDRVASRILGMGDIMTLIEKAQSDIGEDEAKDMQEKLQKAQFNLDDFRKQMRRLKKMGSIEGLLKMIPGMGKIKDKIKDLKVPEKEMVRLEAIINSMTPAERKNPKLFNASRKKRIAAGSGTTVQDVNQLLKNFEQMQKMMQKMVKQGGGGSAAPSMPGMPGMPSMPGLTGTGGGKSATKPKPKPRRKKVKRNKKKK